MPIEQMTDAKSVGPTADVFALGVILYECLAGVRPFAASNPVEIYARVAGGVVDPIRQTRPEVPEWLEQVVARCLAGEASERFFNGSALAIALERRGEAAPVESDLDGQRKPKGTRAVVLGIFIGVLASLVLGGVVLALVLSRAAERPLVQANPAAPPSFSPAQSPAVRPPVEIGWHGEELFHGMTRATERDIYIWDNGRGLKVEMVYVPAGTFTMGSSRAGAPADQKPQHQHPIPDPFWIGRYETTWGQCRIYWRDIGAPFSTPPKLSSEDSHPMGFSSWDGAIAFCKWANLRLPTEAEWERAARGTDARLYPWGDQLVAAHTQANICDASCPEPLEWKEAGLHDGFPYTAPVGSFPEGVSPVGALDMAGNVAEWCEDWYDSGAYSRYARGDFSLPLGGSAHVTRGGSWAQPWWDAMTTARGFCETSSPGGIGFRVAKSRPN